ncbi:tRNA delta(2)-isopentenylpyrophosphate transferase [Geoanaerobacter pelophilus]|uniref:tRNA dimethylallyltransferase n=1 Tax=Geoanaerobacter pelophilus TaxID=60036 RepID=A0ABQ0MFI7_9BACT|nr:tRNA (adenosine(37)-N6)-dimethylallyltransferase MiaA [Geoanaerobacter pelophilus]GAW65861.1 tRNA delta(2)-isopentenylpyrophosphate transferase [Geoanaerobacter pelophilus]
MTADFDLAGRTPNLLVILGATASGKTRLGVQLAGVLNGEIISADSRQVYCGMDLGTGKDLHEYQGIPYHLIDVAQAGEEFNLFRFQRLFLKAFTDVKSRGAFPILVGGSGMYLDCVLRGYHLPEVPQDPALREKLAPLTMEELAARLIRSTPLLHNSTDLTERARLIRAIEIAEHQGGGSDDWPVLTPLTVGIRWERGELRKRITQRLKERLEQGMVEEVARLHALGVTWEQLEFYGLEYRYLARYLKGELSRNDMFQKLNSAIHDFAKKQENWFRKMQTKGTVINWVEGGGDPLAEALELIRRAGLELTHNY